MGRAGHGWYTAPMPVSRMPLPPAHRLAHAVALSPADRMRQVEAFFAAFPRSSSGPHGLGQAILDFQRWEIGSGRIQDAGGSPWWRGVNGMMVLDIAAAQRGDAATTPAIRAWRDYATSPDPQAALWDAHQRSLHAGIRACAALLAAEPEAEQRFAALVIDVVDRTALAGTATDNDGLARLTDRFYPAIYPIAAGSLVALDAMRQKTAARLLDGTGRPFSNAGMDSTRWG